VIGLYGDDVPKTAEVSSCCEATHLLHEKHCFERSLQPSMQLLTGGLPVLFHVATMPCCAVL
jgi:hypothetical protein